MKKQGAVGKPSLSAIVGDGKSDVVDMAVAGRVYLAADDVPHDGPSRYPAPSNDKAKVDKPTGGSLGCQRAVGK